MVHGTEIPATRDMVAVLSTGGQLIRERGPIAEGAVEYGKPDRR